jgi:hypothetical protein
LIWVSIASWIFAKPASRIDASFSWWWALRWWRDSNQPDVPTISLHDCLPRQILVGGRWHACTIYMSLTLPAR